MRVFLKKMAHLVSSFGGIARRAVNRAAVQAFARPFAANAVAIPDEDSFLKWTTPEPVQYTHAGILAGNETKVSVKKSHNTHVREERSSSGEGRRHGGSGADTTRRAPRPARDSWRRPASERVFRRGKHRFRTKRRCASKLCGWIASSFLPSPPTMGGFSLRAHFFFSEGEKGGFSLIFLMSALPCFSAACGRFCQLGFLPPTPSLHRRGARCARRAFARPRRRLLHVVTPLSVAQQRRLHARA